MILFQIQNFDFEKVICNLFFFKIFFCLFILLSIVEIWLITSLLIAHILKQLLSLGSSLFCDCITTSFLIDLFIWRFQQTIIVDWIFIYARHFLGNRWIESEFSGCILRYLSQCILITINILLCLIIILLSYFLTIGCKNINNWEYK